MALARPVSASPGAGIPGFFLSMNIETVSPRFVLSGNI
jgi:hypothetical protein